MTSLELYAYADRFARQQERQGKGTKYPTFRQIAKRFRVKYDDIQDCVDDYHGDAYMGVSIGFQIQGVGCAEHSSRGEYEVEAYV